MAKQALRVGSKVKVKVDGAWTLARIAAFEDAGLAKLERLDQEKGVPPEHRTVYARVGDLRAARTPDAQPQPQPEGEQP
jgi:hypothetical protein